MGRIASIPVSLLATALMLGGCATTIEPRAYLPVVQPPPADTAAFERDFSACTSQVAGNAAVFRSNPELRAVKDQDMSLPAGGSIGPGDMGSGAIGLIALIIMAGQAGARSHAKHSYRQTTEQQIQAAMASCLSERGHTVTAWQLVQAGKAPAGQVLTPTQPEGRALLVQEAEQAEYSAKIDPDGGARSLKEAADRYDRLAEAASDPQERERYVQKAAEARRKADEPGPRAIKLRMAPYGAEAGGSALSDVPPRTFAVEAVRDARPDVLSASRIADVGKDLHQQVATIPPPAQLVQDVFSGELSAAGHRSSLDNPDLHVVPEMRRFEIWAEGKVFPLDVTAAVDVTVSLRSAQQPERARDYSAQCAGHAGWWSGPDAEFMSKLVADCLKQIGGQFRQDAAVRDFLTATRPQN